MNAKTLTAALNAALYAAAAKAGFADVLRHYQAEVYVATWEGRTIAYVNIEEEVVNAERECDVVVDVRLRPALARAEKFVAAYCAKHYPTVRDTFAA